MKLNLIDILKNVVEQNKWYKNKNKEVYIGLNPDTGYVSIYETNELGDFRLFSSFIICDYLFTINVEEVDISKIIFDKSEKEFKDVYKIYDILKEAANGRCFISDDEDNIIIKKLPGKEQVNIFKFKPKTLEFVNMKCLEIDSSITKRNFKEVNNIGELLEATK